MKSVNFGDNEELLVFAFQTTADRLTRRVAALAEVRVWFAFLGLALIRRVPAHAQRNAYRTCRRSLEDALRRAQGQGEIEADVDVQDEAAALVAVIDGLALQASFEPRVLPPSPSARDRGRAAREAEGQATGADPLASGR